MKYTFASETKIYWKLTATHVTIIARVRFRKLDIYIMVYIRHSPNNAPRPTWRQSTWHWYWEQEKIIRICWFKSDGVNHIFNHYRNFSEHDWAVGDLILQRYIIFPKTSHQAEFYFYKRRNWFTHNYVRWHWVNGIICADCCVRALPLGIPN